MSMTSTFVLVGIGALGGVILGAAAMLVIAVRVGRLDRFRKHVIIGVDSQGKTVKRALKSAEAVAWN